MCSPTELQLNAAVDITSVEWAIQLNGVVHIENTDIRKAMVPVTLPSGI